MITAILSFLIPMLSLLWIHLSGLILTHTFFFFFFQERLNSGNPASTGTTLTGSNLISLSGGVGCPGTSASNERTSNSAVGE